MQALFFLKIHFHTVHLPTFMYYSEANFPFVCTANMYTCYMTSQSHLNTRVGTLIVATIYLQLIQNRYIFEVLLSFIVVTSIVYNPLPAMWKS